MAGSGRGAAGKHERPGGGYGIGGSKTVAVAVDRLYAAFVERGERQRWLPGAEIALRTSQPGRSARFDWTDGSSRLHVHFTDKGERSTATVQHERLADAGEAERMKAFWKARLEELKRLVERRPASE